ncbi:MAG: DUF2905 domain-containing protein [Sedimentisphaerales bacterium]|nr:DUF2905 domain-containing protein [Sedimentisphaerales bacterium]
MEQFGKIITFAGLVIVACGAILYLMGKLGIGQLPGDVSFGGKYWRIFLPIGTCILLSVLLTLIFFIINHFRR